MSQLRNPRPDPPGLSRFVLALLMLAAFAALLLYIVWA